MSKMKPVVKDILNIQRSVLIPYGEAMCYKNWSQAFKNDNFKQSIKKIQNIRVDVTQLNADECLMLGFGNWDDKLWIIPIWLYNNLEFGIELHSINGNRITVMPNYDDPNGPAYIDNDHRSGLLAWGFYPK